MPTCEIKANSLIAAQEWDYNDVGYVEDVSDDWGGTSSCIYCAVLAYWISYECEDGPKDIETVTRLDVKIEARGTVANDRVDCAVRIAGEWQDVIQQVVTDSYAIYTVGPWEGEWTLAQLNDAGLALRSHLTHPSTVYVATARLLATYTAVTGGFHLRRRYLNRVTRFIGPRS